MTSDIAVFARGDLFGGMHLGRSLTLSTGAATERADGSAAPAPWFACACAADEQNSATPTTTRVASSEAILFRTKDMRMRIPLAPQAGDALQSKAELRSKT